MNCLRVFAGIRKTGFSNTRSTKLRRELRVLRVFAGIFLDLVPLSKKTSDVFTRIGSAGKNIKNTRKYPQITSLRVFFPEHPQYPQNQDVHMHFLFSTHARTYKTTNQYFLTHARDYGGVSCLRI